MKSANITSLPGMGDMGVAPQRTVAKQDDENKPVDFKALMHRSVLGSGNTPKSQANAGSVPESVKESKPSSTFESPKKDNLIDKTAKDQPISREMKDNARDTYGKIEDAVKETVAEELGITEDELEEAMEVLGLSYIDLFDPTNMQMLLGQIAEQIPELSMDMQALDPATLVDGLEAVAAPILQEADLSPEEMDYLLTELVPTDEPAIAESFAGVLEKAGIPSDMLADKAPTEEKAIPLHESFAPVRPEADKGSGVRIISVVDEEPEVPTEQVDAAAVQTGEETATPVVGQPAQEAATVTVQTNTAPKAETVITDEAAEEPIGAEQAVILTEETAEGLSEESGFTSTDNGGSRLQERTAENTSANDVLSAANQGPAVHQNFAQAVEAVQQADVTMPYTSVDAADVIDQIVTNAQMTITDEITRMEIELNPQTLGRMIMQVQSNNDGVVTAKLIAQNEAVREALETQMNILRENLNNRGIRVEAVEVTVGTHEFERSLEEGQQQAGQYEDQSNGQPSQGGRTRNLNRSELDELQGLMTEEEELAARIMRDEGNTLNYQA